MWPMGSFDYDSRNRLIQSGKAGSLTSYVYDAEDVLVGVTEPGGVSRYTIDPNHGLSKMLQRFKNGDRTRYVHGVGLIYETDGDDFRVYHYDYRGSTVALTDEAGAVTDRFTYTPYGVEERLLGSTDTPFRYNGQYGVISLDDGLVHMRARFYHPELRRFLNADPLQFGGGNNWFAYANGNPVSYVDPFGLFGWRDALGFVPVVGSVLDAVDSFKEGNILMGIAHIGLAALDLTGGGAIVSGITKGAVKTVAKKLARKKLLRNKTTLERNKIIGKLGEDAVVKRLRANKSIEVLETQLQITTPGAGSFRTLDVLVRGRKTGRLRNIEVKTGGATRNNMQLLKDQVLARGHSLTNPNLLTRVRGQRLKRFGLDRGSPIGPIRTHEINATSLIK